MKLIKYLLPVVAIFISVTSAKAQTQPETAEKIINDAKAEAAGSHKNVFVIFHASWCVWCHRMDTAMNDKQIKSFFDKSYVIKHLTVDENGDKKKLENPGANAIRTKYHGDEQGIPYWFIIDKDGNFLADSRIVDASGKQGNNVGCPSQPDEVDYFITVLKKTSALNNNQLELIKQRFLKNNS